MAIFDALKLAANLYKESGKIEQYKEILEAQEQLLEMQKKIADLESKNRECEEKLKIKENLIYENNAYWINIEGKKDGPFCSRCWDKDKYLIRMHPTANPASNRCPECKNIFKTGHEDYMPPMINQGNLEPY